MQHVVADSPVLMPFYVKIVCRIRGYETVVTLFLVSLSETALALRHI